MADPAPAWLRRALDERDGHVCAWHGVDERSGLCEPRTLVPHHRQGGMGGSPSKHRLSVVVWLCSRANGEIESDPDLQRVAVERGFKTGHVEPAGVPIEHQVHGRVLLADDGSVVRLTERWG